MGHNSIKNKLAYSFWEGRGVLRSAIRSIANSQEMYLFVAESGTDRIIILYDFSGPKVAEDAAGMAEIGPRLPHRCCCRKEGLVVRAIVRGRADGCSAEHSREHHETRKN